MRLTIKDLEAMKTHELAELFSNLVMVLRQGPDIPVSLMIARGRNVSTMSETEVTETVQALLTRLPENYPKGEFTKESDGYRLVVGGTAIFHRASGLDAIKDTANYVVARKDSPTLPVGVIYGIYD